MVLRDEFGDSYEVTGVNWLEGEVARREVAKESGFCLPSQAACDQIGHLGQNQRRNDQRTRVGLQQLETCRVMSVVPVDVGIQRTSVNDQRDESTSARMSSSIRSEILL